MSTTRSLITKDLNTPTTPVLPTITLAPPVELGPSRIPPRDKIVLAPLVTTAILLILVLVVFINLHWVDKPIFMPDDYEATLREEELTFDEDIDLEKFELSATPAEPTTSIPFSHRPPPVPPKPLGYAKSSVGTQFSGSTWTLPAGSEHLQKSRSAGGRKATYTNDTSLASESSSGVPMSKASTPSRRPTDISRHRTPPAKKRVEEWRGQLPTNRAEHHGSRHLDVQTNNDRDSIATARFSALSNDHRATHLPIGPQYAASYEPSEFYDPSVVGSDAPY